MNIEQQRKAFDEWYGIKPKGWFEAVRYNTAWKAWLAAQKQEGHVMVPVEPSLETMQKMNREFIDSEFETPKYRMQQVYKAMIQAAQE